MPTLHKLFQKTEEGIITNPFYEVTLTPKSIKDTRTWKGFPGGPGGKESACNVGDLGSIPGLGGCLWGGHGNPLQYSRLENPLEQRSLVGYSPRGCRVGHNWATKCSSTWKEDFSQIAVIKINANILKKKKAQNKFNNYWKNLILWSKGTHPRNARMF